MTLDEILRTDTAAHLDLVRDDFWDAENCCAYSADGFRLLDAENFPSEVTVREGCRILCDWVFAFQDYMAENDHFGGEIPPEERASYLDKIKLPASITHIGKGAFLECGFLRSIRLPKGLLSIGDMAFKDCWELEGISCPAALVNIGERAFEDCFSLYNVRLNKGLRRLGPLAFHCCEELEEIDLPGGIEEIAPDAFDGCISLKTIYIPEGTAEKFRALLPKNIFRKVEEF